MITIKRLIKYIQTLGFCRHFQSKGEPLSANMICLIKTHRAFLIIPFLFSTISTASMIRFVSNILEETQPGNDNYEKTHKLSSGGFIIVRTAVFGGGNTYSVNWKEMMSAFCRVLTLVCDFARKPSFLHTFATLRATLL